MYCRIKYNASSIPGITRSCSTQNLKSWKEIPGLAALPVIGSLHHFLPVIGVVGSKDAQNELPSFLRKTYGPLVKLESILTRGSMIYIYDLNQTEKIIRSEEAQPTRHGMNTLGYYRKVVKADYFNGMYGMLHSQGDSWKQFRSRVNPALMNLKIIRLYYDSVDEIAREIIEKLKRLRDSDNKIKDSLDNELNKWALESIAVIGLGTRIGCLKDDLEEDSPANILIQTVKDTFYYAHELDSKPSLWKYFATPTFKRAMKCYDTQMRVSEWFINKSMEELKKSTNENREKSVLERLMEIDPKVALITALDMLFAGVDTTSHTLINTMYLLAKNKDKQVKLLEEILEGNERTYLRACIKESTRMRPIVSATLRHSTKEYVIDGYLIPKGIDLVFPNEYFSNLEDNFLRPDEFIPERWLVDKSDPLSYKHAHPMTMLPFGYGIRSCVGRRIAEMELEVFLTHCIKNFELDWQGPPLKKVRSIITTTGPPYHFIFNDRKY